MDAKYDALSESQKEAAELMVDGAINKKKNPKEKPMTQTAIAETVASLTALFVIGSRMNCFLTTWGTCPGFAYKRLCRTL